MAQNYTTFVSQLANMLVVPSDDVNYLAAIPNIITDAEQRIYRELDLLSTIVRASGALVASNRNFTLPTTQGTFVVVEQMNIISPAGITNPDQGERLSMLPVSKEVLDIMGGSPSYTGVPSMFAPISQQEWIVGPAWPDAAYTVEVVGTIRPAPLSEGNPTTFLTQYLDDVFMAAALVYAAGYQLNFSAAADNPQAGVNWETHLQKLLASAQKEEFRKKFGSQSWSSKEPDPIATPPRA